MWSDAALDHDSEIPFDWSGVSLCATTLHDKHPMVPAMRGAKKPILSLEFHDRIQVDLIDMRSMRKRDVYGQMQRWIMTVKDHSTGLVYLCALPRKRATFVAADLEKFFRFIGYPEFFYTGVYSIMLIQ